VDAALPIADSLAERIYCKVVVAVLRGHRRLTVVETGPGGQASPALRESDDCYTTAGGRMLLALLPDRRQRAALEELGHPGLRWPAAAKLPKTAQALRAIARDRRSIKGEGRWALAVGQEVPGHGLISIGCNSDAVPDVDSVESWTAALHEGLGRLAGRLGDCSELL
jgi:DNA-binding IclR family transcriptional regulator